MQKVLVLNFDYSPLNVTTLRRGFILVDSGKNHKQWYDSIKKLINNPEQIEILATNLHNTVKDTYSISAVTEKRRELYLDLLKNTENSNYLRKNVVVTEKV